MRISEIEQLPTPAALTAAIKATIELFMSSGRVKSTYEIGSGWCDVFAHEVRKALGYPKETGRFYLENTTGLWGEEFSIDQRHAPHLSQDVLDRIGEATHEWIVLNGRHYDAEVPEGVDHWYDMPFFKRWIDGERES